MTVCALAIDVAATKASSVRRANMVAVSVSCCADEDYVGVDQVGYQKGRVVEMLRPVVLTGLATQDWWRIHRIPVPRSAHT